MAEDLVLPNGTVIPAADVPAFEAYVKANATGETPESALSEADRTAIIERYPSFAHLLKIPELADLFGRSISATGGWSIEEFGYQLQETEWYRTTPEAGRTYQVMQITNPADAERLRESTYETYRDLAATEGIKLTADELRDLTHWGLNVGWTEDEYIDNLMTRDDPNDNTFGQIDDEQSTLKEIAANYGVSVGDNITREWAVGIRGGRKDRGGWEEWMKKRAKGLYRGVAEEIDEGFTVRELYDPFRQAAATALGIAPEQIDLTDPKWSKPLNYKAEGQGEPRMMDLDEWNRTIVSDDRYGWGDSTNGKKEGYRLSREIARAMGMPT